MRFGAFRIDRERLVLEHGGSLVSLPPKSVELLAVLVERSGELVTKHQLLDRLWPDRAVEEANLSQHVYLIRKTLSACDPAARESIVTVPKRGYRFVRPEPPAAFADDRPRAAAGEALLQEFERASAGGARTLSTERTAADRPAHESHRLAGQPTAATDRSHPPALAWKRGLTASPRPAAVRWIAAAVCLLIGMFATAAVSQRRSLPPELSVDGSAAARLGRYYLDLRTPTGIARSRTYFARAVATDPRNPAGYAGLADAFTMTADYELGTQPPMTYLHRAERYARRAAALDPDSAAAHTSLGIIAHYIRDERAAERELQSAIALDPNYAPAHHWLGTLLFDNGSYATSLRELTIAAQLNPMSTASNVWLSMVAYFEHRYDTAIEHGRRALELDPGRTDSLRELGLAYDAKGDYRAALATFARIPRTSREAALAPFLIAGVYAHAGRGEIARRIIERERRRHIANSELPFTLLALGETHAAALAAARLRPRDCSGQRSFIADPRFDHVRGSADFDSVFTAACSTAD